MYQPDHFRVEDKPQMWALIRARPFAALVSAGAGGVFASHLRPGVMDDAVWLRRHVTELSAQQERGSAQPWAVSDAPDRYIEVMLRGIVGLRFVITRLAGMWKK